MAGASGLPVVAKGRLARQRRGPIGGAVVRVVERGGQQQRREQQHSTAQHSAAQQQQQQQRGSPWIVVEPWLWLVARAVGCGGGGLSRRYGQKGGI